MTDAQTKKTSLLLLDDDQFLLDMYARKFKNSGFEVEAIGGATAALQKLRDGYRPSAILCDLIMPGVDGLEFIEKMQAERLAPDAAVIVLTNTSQPADIARAKSLSVGGYIVKVVATPSEGVKEVENFRKKKQKRGECFGSDFSR